MHQALIFSFDCTGCWCDGISPFQSDPCKIEEQRTSKLITFRDKLKSIVILSHLWAWGPFSLFKSMAWGVPCWRTHGIGSFSPIHLKLGWSFLDRQSSPPAILVEKESLQPPSLKSSIGNNSKTAIQPQPASRDGFSPSENTVPGAACWRTHRTGILGPICLTLGRSWGRGSPHSPEILVSFAWKTVTTPHEKSAIGNNGKTVSFLPHFVKEMDHNKEVCQTKNYR